MQAAPALSRHAPAALPNRLQHSCGFVIVQAFALLVHSMEAHGTRQSTSDDPWSKLMTAAQAGDGGAYNRLLTEVAAWLRRYYARRLPPSYVDDIVQEALVAIHLKRHTYEPERPFRAWMAGIARYKWIDRLRSIDRNRVDPITGFDGLAADYASAVTARLDIQNLLIRLNPAQADVIRLVKLEGYSIQEASAATGQSMALVKVNIHRGIARLASEIESDDDVA